MLKLLCNENEVKRMNQAKIYDIAGAAGVSLATVSRVLNHPEKVKAETREKVLRIIKEKGYKPNANARGLASRRSTTVAIVVPNITRASVAEMIQGISDSAKKFGYMMRLFVNDEKRDGKELWSDVIASSVDGILLLNDEMNKETYDLIKHTPVPVLFVNSYSKDLHFGSVGIDYEGCAYQTTKEMIERGNKNIMFVTTESKYSVNDMMAKGYENAMKEASLPINIFKTSGDLDINEKQFQDLVKTKLPEVALVVRDSIAISLMNIASREGIKVPDQLQLIGFQNTRYALLSNPKLTCVETPIYEIGNVAMETLTNFMHEDQIDVDIDSPHIVVDYKIIWRESTK